MKNKNVTIVERDDGYGYRVYYWDLDKRRSKTFKLKSDAANFAREQSEERTLPEEIVVSMEERLFLARIRKLGDIKDVLKFLDANYRVAEKNALFKSAFDAFVAEKTRTNRRSSTVDEYVKYYRRIGNVYDDVPVKDMGLAIAEKIISTQGTESMRTHCAVCMSAFFNWCISKKYCVSNPFYAHKKSDVIKERGHVKTLSPAESLAFMASLPEPLRAGYAIMLFAGVRPEEMFNDDGKPVLNWRDIDFKNRKICVQAATAKTRRARLLQDLPDNLWDWLNAYRGTSENVIARSAGRIAKLRQSACALAGIKYSQDVCRHTFASCGYYFLGAEHTVEIMGHVGGFATFAKNYKGVRSVEEAKEFFAITPAKCAAYLAKKKVAPKS